MHLQPNQKSVHIPIQTNKPTSIEKKSSRHVSSWLLNLLSITCLLLGVIMIYAWESERLQQRPDSYAQPNHSLLTVEELSGEVWSGYDRLTSLQASQSLSSGETVRTGLTSRAVLKTSHNDLLILEPNTEARFIFHANAISPSLSEEIEGATSQIDIKLHYGTIAHYQQNTEPRIRLEYFDYQFDLDRGRTLFTTTPVDLPDELTTESNEEPNPNENENQAKESNPAPPSLSLQESREKIFFIPPPELESPAQTRETQEEQASDITTDKQNSSALSESVQQPLGTAANRPPTRFRKLTVFALQRDININDQGGNQRLLSTTSNLQLTQPAAEIDWFTVPTWPLEIVEDFPESLRRHVFAGDITLSASLSESIGTVNSFSSSQEEKEQAETRTEEESPAEGIDIPASEETAADSPVEKAGDEAIPASPPETPTITPQATPTTELESGSGDCSEFTYELLSALNKKRLEQNRDQIVCSPNASRMAQNYAAQLAQANTLLSHPKLNQRFDQFGLGKDGIKFELEGTLTSTNEAKTIVQQWLVHPQRKAELLHPELDYAGAQSIRGASNYYFVLVVHE